MGSSSPYPTRLQVAESPLVGKGIKVAERVLRSGDFTAVTPAPERGQVPCFPSTLPLGKFVPPSPAPLVARGVRWGTTAVSARPTPVTPADLALTGLSGPPRALSVQTSALAMLERLAASGLTAVSCVDTLLSSLISALVDPQTDSASFRLKRTLMWTLSVRW